MARNLKYYYDDILELGGKRFINREKLIFTYGFYQEKGVLPKRIYCEENGVIPLSKEGFDDLKQKINSNLYRSSLRFDDTGKAPLHQLDDCEKNSYILWDAIYCVFNSISDINTFFSVRQTCKSALIYMDANVNVIWQNIQRNNVSYRPIPKKFEVIHTVLFLKKVYPRLFYTTRIHNYHNAQESLFFHLVHGNLMIAIDVAEKNKIASSYLAIQIMNHSTLHDFAANLLNIPNHHIISCIEVSLISLFLYCEENRERSMIEKLELLVGIVKASSYTLRSFRGTCINENLMGVRKILTDRIDSEPLLDKCYRNFIFLPLGIALGAILYRSLKSN